MPPVLPIDSPTSQSSSPHGEVIAAEHLIPLVTNYNLMPQLLSERIIDQAIATIQCSDEETAQACQNFYQQRGLTTEAEQQAWRSHYNLSQTQIEQLATRSLRVEIFKQVTWGNKLESYFLKRKRQLDRVIYSMIRVKNREMASELFFRIAEGEQSFAQLATNYGEGPEAQTNGLLGPIEFGSLLPKLADLLYTRTIGEVQHPIQLGEWHIIVRVEKLIPAQFNQSMQQRLLQENFESWFQAQVNQLSDYERAWMSIAPSPKAIAA